MDKIKNISELDLSVLVGKTEEKPMVCSNCGKKLEYTGLGEYRCPECGRYDYDDYGKIRLYLETHPKATIVEIERATGVSRHSINQMVNEDRFDIT